MVKPSGRYANLIQAIIVDADAACGVYHISAKSQILRALADVRADAIEECATKAALEGVAPEVIAAIRALAEATV